MTINYENSFFSDSWSFFPGLDSLGLFSDSWTNKTSEDQLKNLLNRDFSSFFYPNISTSLSSKQIKPLKPSSYYFDFPKVEKIRKIVANLQSCMSTWQQNLKDFVNYPLKDRFLTAFGFAVDPSLSRLANGALTPIGMGLSGCYFWKNNSQNIEFIVKPIDEDIGGINNPKGYVSLEEKSNIRDFMPLYKSAFKEAFVYDLAKLLKVDSIAPKTALMILESSDFSSYIYDQLKNQTSDLELLENIQKISKQKLCSVQDFVPNSQILANVIEKSTDVCMTQELSRFYSLLKLNFDLGDSDVSCDARRVYLNKLQGLITVFLDLQIQILTSNIQFSSDIELQNYLFALTQLKLMFSLAKEKQAEDPLCNLQQNLLDRLENDFWDVPASLKAQFYDVVQKAFVRKEKLNIDEINIFNEFLLQDHVSNPFKSKLLGLCFANQYLDSLIGQERKLLGILDQSNDLALGSDDKIFIQEFAQYLKSRSKWNFDCFFTQKPIDRDDFEDVSILNWVNFDTDAHLGNILCYEKQSLEGSVIYGLKKIDNGLTFPEQNKGLRNLLKYHRNSFEKLSLKGREKILNLDEESVVEKMKFYGLDYAQSAFRERMAVLKRLASNPDLTIRDIDSMLQKSFENIAW